MFGKMPSFLLLAHMLLLVSCSSWGTKDSVAKCDQRVPASANQKSPLKCSRSVAQEKNSLQQPEYYRDPASLNRRDTH